MRKGLILNGNTTEIICMIDRSGSMYSIMSDAIGGFNSFIEEQKKVPGECLITLVLFDSEVKVIYEKISLNDVPLLTEEVYMPGGSTALLDAIGMTISKYNIEKETNSNIKRLFVILTDGQENASKEYNSEVIKKLVEELREKENNEFIFLGANIDSFSTSYSLGMSVGNTMNYVADSFGTRSAFTNIGQTATLYRTSLNYDKDNLMQKEDEN